MNYTFIYQNLCKRGQFRSCNNKKYYESHHILPKCLGGSDEKHNLTNLTPREHFLAHKILCILYKNTRPAMIKLSSALNMMCIHSTNNRRFKSKDYEFARNLFSKNHPMKLEKNRQKVKNSLKKYWEVIKKIKNKELPFCECGCGNKVKTKKRKYLYNHWNRSLIKKGFTKEVKEKLKEKAKQRIEKLSPLEKTERLKKTLHSDKVDHIMRGIKISNSKKGKKTNQCEIMGKRFSKMSDKDFYKYLEKKSPYVWKRYTNLRNKWKKQ